MRAPWLAAGLGMAVTTAQAAPGLLGVAPVRRRVSPRLHGIGDPGHVALTFDDGPDVAATPALLKVLDELGWRATFFLLGTMAHQAPALVAEMVAAGHEIGVHGHSHRSHLLRPPPAVVEDVRRGASTVAEVSGTHPRWFRPPYGGVSAGSLIAAHRLNLEMVLWSTWGRDWRAAATPASVVTDVEADRVPGATILLHDSDCMADPGSWRTMLAALPLLAERLSADGLEVGPLRDHRIPGRRASYPGAT